ncbi:hypothetical protein PR003_g29831 [Phytophthora rubi]|uniref:Uncharacterized protein n=1 Tax=Phytophthora rubi TaxID=129364 RepID=A0A6A4BGC4_9STRA|nr:hypothetical protein PR003_g29831 [Phytophthora rubi]
MRRKKTFLVTFALQEVVATNTRFLRTRLASWRRFRASTSLSRSPPSSPVLSHLSNCRLIRWIRCRYP